MPEGSVSGITYQDIEERILIVGAAENTRDEDGNYQMATFSNFGSTVDICAPGEQIYTAVPGGYVEDSRGTSLAAPLVTGSAALLWSLDSALSAPEVRSLLLENATVQAYAGKGQTGTYPMLHIGQAAQALLEQKGLERVCAVSVTDGETGEPVEDAVVTLLDVEALGTAFDLTGEDPLYRFRVEEQGTDADGQTVFTDCTEDAYPVYIRAQGYEDWTGWLDVSSYFPSEGEPQVNAVSLTPGPQADALLREKLEELAAQYGVMPVGTELFAGTGYGAGEHLIPPERLTGLLCADMYDYDGDGQEELLTVRAQPAEAYSPGDSASPGWVDIRLYISVYEAGTGGAVELADEREISIPGLPDTLFSSSIQFARGTSGGSASLYLDYYFNFNSQGLSTIRLQYKGQLAIAGGVDCSEFAYQAYLSLIHISEPTRRS